MQSLAKDLIPPNARHGQTFPKTAPRMDDHAPAGSAFTDNPVVQPGSSMHFLEQQVSHTYAMMNRTEIEACETVPEELLVSGGYVDFDLTKLVHHRDLFNDLAVEVTVDETVASSNAVLLRPADWFAVEFLAGNRATTPLKFPAICAADIAAFSQRKDVTTHEATKSPLDVTSVTVSGAQSYTVRLPQLLHILRHLDPKLGDKANHIRLVASDSGVLFSGSNTAKVTSLKLVATGWEMPPVFYQTDKLNLFKKGCTFIHPQVHTHTETVDTTAGGTVDIPLKKAKGQCAGFLIYVRTAANKTGQWEYLGNHTTAELIKTGNAVTGKTQYGFDLHLHNQAHCSDRGVLPDPTASGPNNVALLNYFNSFHRSIEEGAIDGAVTITDTDHFLRLVFKAPVANNTWSQFAQNVGSTSFVFTVVALMYGHLVQTPNGAIARKD